jgi:subtilase family serine protease
VTGFGQEDHVISMTSRRAAAAVTGAVTAAALALTGAGTSHAATRAAPLARAACGAAAAGQARCFALIRTDATARTAAALADDANKPPPGFGSAALEAAYRLPVADGAGQTVAVVDAYDDPTAATDLATYRTREGLPPCSSAGGCFTKVNQEGQRGSYPQADGGWAVEISLDLDMVSSACPRCHILLVEGNSASVADLGASEVTAAKLGAVAISNSYGLSEFGGMQALYADYHPAGAAVVASSGDGAFGATQFPAVAPGVTAVGGTSLYKSAIAARGWVEHAWSGAGSGCSAYVKKPAYQDQVSPHCTMRVTADVSAVADPNTGLAIYDKTPNPFGLKPGWLEVGGTSASSPFIAGVIALAGNGATFHTGRLYSHGADLNDVTAGSNGFCGGDYLCTAKKGYDGPTGMGTPNGTGAF